MALIFFVFATCTLYWFLLNKENRVVVPMATAHSAHRIIAGRKPFLLYGTAWKKERTASLVSQAVHAGFRFIDTACQPRHYNESGVGVGWSTAAQEIGLKRSDLFLQTKFTSEGGQDPHSIPYDPEMPVDAQVRTSLGVSLKVRIVLLLPIRKDEFTFHPPCPHSPFCCEQNLKTDYLDSLVLHSPFEAFDDTMTAWRTMESFVDDGKVHRLGISNCYDLELFKALYEEARVKPTVLQNRFHAETGFDTELREYCKDHNIWYQSFWTLTANRHALNLPQVREWAAKFDLSPQTLMFAFLMELGYITPLSGTTNTMHMSEDVAVMKRVQEGEKFFENEEDLFQFAKILGMPEL